MDEMTWMAVMHDKNVIGFNARGIEGSKGEHIFIQDMVQDGIAQVNLLLETGVPKEKITLEGISFGGAVAVFVAKYFKEEKGIDSDVIANRPFSTLTQAVAAQIPNYVKPTFLGKFLAWVATPIIKVVLVVTGWEMDVVAAYKTLDPDHKATIVVRSPAEERAKKPVPIDDEVIPYKEASLAYALKSLVKSEKEKHGYYSKDAERGIVLKVNFYDPTTAVILFQCNI